LKHLRLALGILIVAAAYVFMILSLPGLRTFLAAMLLFMLPTYLILDRYDFTDGEKLMFSFFIGIGVFSALVYNLSLLIGSIRISMALVFVVLVGLGIYLKLKR